MYDPFKMYGQWVKTEHTNKKFVIISGHRFCAQTWFLRQTLHELHVDKNIQENPIM